MNNKQILRERRQLMKVAGILNEANRHSAERAFKNDLTTDPDFMALQKINRGRRIGDMEMYGTGAGDTGQTPRANDRDYYVDKFQDPEEYIDLDDEDGLYEDSDYDMGTPSGDTDAMNIAEYGPSSVRDMDAAADVVVAALEYMERHADTEDEGGMNEAGQLAQSLEDLLDFLQTMK